ncbi:hypothetical protein FOC4_g10000523 [Fusarium odoratissimum]|uniref:Uncharacterized protein n=2 Tax=Fusarium oxysporum species complex TaxID=171631 RepID=N1SBH3_FUSC4|nr:hypothetical protein FOC4_g10000523 [Fusarium odoratissimum]TXB97232.1 hypothetical protein FocTR4_00011994 [Fusarium oxysporum f. sp. cubense]
MDMDPHYGSICGFRGMDLNPVENTRRGPCAGSATSKCRSTGKNTVVNRVISCKEEFYKL